MRKRKIMQTGMAILLTLTMAGQSVGVCAESFGIDTEFVDTEEKDSLDQKNDYDTEDSETVLENEIFEENSAITNVETEENGEEPNSEETVENDNEINSEVDSFTDGEGKDDEAMDSGDLASDPTISAFSEGEETTEENVRSGVCGDNLTWNVDEDGVLTISGTGEMYDYPSKKGPWENIDIKAVICEEGVTRIGDYAFCSMNLISANLPKVKKVGVAAFSGCSNLHKVEMPEVERIERWAFNNTGIENIDMGNLTTICEATFRDCNNLKSVNLPNVEIIEKEAFTSCDFLTDVKLPKVKIISEYAFNRDFELSNIEMPLVETIGMLAFNSCRSLTKVEAPMVISIEYSAFQYCTNISSIELPNVEHLEGGAFYYCKNITNIDLPSVKEIESGAFAECSSLISVNLPVLNKCGSSAFIECENLVDINIENAQYIGFDAFQGCLNLSAINIPNVQAINKGVFKKCKSLKAIVLKEGINEIAEGAFENCTDLEAIVVPATVSLIGSTAFSGTGLKSVFFRGNPQLGENAFAVSREEVTYYYPISNNWTEDFVKANLLSGGKCNYVEYDKMVPGEYHYNNDELCSKDGTETAECICGCGLTDTREVSGTKDPNKHTWSENYTEFPDGSKVYYCDLCGKPVYDTEESGVSGNLEWKIYNSNVLIISGNGEMEDYDVYNPAPWSGKPITYCKIENGVTSVGSSAFEGCNSLSYIVLSDEITSINGYAFYGCENLREVSIPRSVECIGENAFEGCSSLAKLTAYEKLTSIKSTSFRKCDALTIYGYAGTTIAEFAAEKGINFNALGYWGKCGENITWLAIDGILTIKGSGSIPNYGSVGGSPWAGLNVRHCTIEGEITTLGAYAFSGMEELEDIQLPYELEKIGANAFENCSSLTEVKTRCEYYGEERWELLSENVSSIGDYAFSGCTKLTDFTVPQNVTIINEGVFDGCSALKSVTFNGKVTAINANAFRKCALVQIELPYTMKKIDANAFEGNKFESIFIPTAVTKIHGSAFSGCGNLQGLEVASNNVAFSAINGALFNKEGTELIICPSGAEGTYNVPRSTQKIGEFAFEDCKKITKLVLPGALTTIGDFAFKGMEIASIEIPAEITQFSTNIFTECYNLTSILVDEDNTSYASVDGFLYNHSRDKLVCCPPGLQEVVVPESVSDIDAEVFVGCRAGTVIDLPFWFKSIDENNKFGEDTVFKIYENARIKRTLETRGYNWSSKGKYVLEWDDSNSETYHYAMAFDLLKDKILKSNIRQASITLGQESASLVYWDENAINYCYKFKSDGATAYIKFTLTEKGVADRLFELEVTTSLGDADLWGFRGKLYAPPKQFTSSSRSYNYNWTIKKGYYNNTSTEDANSIANTCLRNALGMLALLSGSAAGLQMKDLGFLSYYNSSSVHTEITEGSIEPTCTTDGAKGEAYCSICGALLHGDEVIPATGHTEVIDEAVEPTCTTTGKTEGSHCSSCGLILKAQDEIPMVDHQKELIAAVEATCTVPGKTEGSRCRNCGIILEQPKEIPRLEHQRATISAVEPTCTTAGKTEGVYCVNCGTILEEQKTVSELGHLKKALATIEATCYSEGLSGGIECSRCGIVLKWPEFLPKTAHEFVEVIDKPATCGEEGRKHKECKVCLEEEPAEIIPAIGKHQYTAYTTVKEATAVESGERIRSCSVCGHVEKQEISKLVPTIKLNATSITLKVKQSTSKIVVSDLSAGDAVDFWKSSNEKIVTVTNSGKITAKNKTGSATLTVTLKSGKTATVKVKVQKGDVKTTKISGLSSKINLKAGKKITLKPVIAPITSVQKITYTTSNKGVASVSKKGVISAKKPGKAKITVKSGAKKFVITVTVKK